MRSLGAAAVILVVALGATGSARAQTVGAGPMLGWVEDEGLSVGWEISGTWGIPLLHASVGGSYRLEAPGGTRAVHYLAWEPWFVIGGTLGVAIDDDGVATGAIGAWEAGPIWIHELRDQRASEAVPAIAVTLAIGWRLMAGRHEIYVTPKLLYHLLPDPFT